MPEKSGILFKKATHSFEIIFKLAKDNLAAILVT